MPPVPIYTSSPITVAKATSGPKPETASPPLAGKPPSQVQIYTSSPINAAKAAAGPNPKTSSPPLAGGLPAAVVTPTPTTPERSDATSPYPPPQPGAVPSMPVPTASTKTRAYAPSQLEPTPTTSDGGAHPPAPQPGAVPVPPSQASSLPPPPRAGETTSMTAAHPPVATAPPQMSIPPPSMPHTQGSATSAGYPAARQAGPRPVALPTATAQDYSHPPGYQQASGSAPSMREWPDEQGSGEDDEGVWGAAKKWAKDAGEKVAAAESEVWRRINKP